VRGKRIAVLGLTFAPNTDDMREAPSITIIRALQDGGASIAAYDPEGMNSAKALLPDVEFGAGPYEVARDADAVVIVTEWNAFRSLDLDQLRFVMRTPVLVDLRNIYSRREVEAHGFAYDCIGRPPNASDWVASEAAA
jgi:UDPglucose 6-dehydrogenase